MVLSLEKFVNDEWPTGIQTRRSIEWVWFRIGWFWKTWIKICGKNMFEQSLFRRFRRSYFVFRKLKCQISNISKFKLLSFQKVEIHMITLYESFADPEFQMAKTKTCGFFFLKISIFDRIHIWGIEFRVKFQWIEWNHVIGNSDADVTCSSICPIHLVTEKNFSA